MLSNVSKNNALYDSYFLEQTFNSPSMLAYSKKEIEWLASELKLSKNTSIIDVACGSGRHLKAFVELGFNPVGLDTSPDCVRLAKENCPSIASGIFQKEFLQFAAEHSVGFDVVFIAGASFGYDPSLDVNLKHFRALLNLVNADGYLVIQYLNRAWAQSIVKKNLTFWSEDSEKFILDKREIDGPLLRSEKIFIKKNDFFQKRYSDVIYTFTDTEIMQNAKNLSLDKLFNKLMIKDSFSGIDYDETNSATPVIILKRSS